MPKEHKTRLLLKAGQHSQRGVSRGTTLIFRCPVCGLDKAISKVSKSGNTLAVRCSACKLMVFDYNYRQSLGMTAE